MTLYTISNTCVCIYIYRYIESCIPSSRTPRCGKHTTNYDKRNTQIV